MDQTLIRGPEYNPDHVVWTMTLLRNHPELQMMVNSNITLQQLLDVRRYPEEDVLKAVHLLILRRVITFNRERTFDSAAFKRRILKIKEDLDKSQNWIDALDILGLTRRATSDDIRRAYRSFAKTYHPDRLPQDCDREILDVTTLVFGKITEIHNVLTDDKGRRAYQKEVAEQVAGVSLQAESLVDQGKAMMKVNNYAEAVSFFNRALELNVEHAEARLHIIWCRLKTISKHPDPSELLVSVEKDLNQIPPEERHSVMYLFVKGLFQLHSGNEQMAKQFLEQAVSVDAKFIEARRELNILALKSQQKHKAESATDLRDIVGRLFRRS